VLNQSSHEINSLKRLPIISKKEYNQILDLLFVSMWLWEWLKTLGDQCIWVKKLNLDVQKL